MKVWVSKYALSNRGRIALEAVRESSAEGYVSLDGWALLKIGRDCHETKEQAIVAAEAARLKKIASLKKQIERLEAMKFTAAAEE